MFFTEERLALQLESSTPVGRQSLLGTSQDVAKEFREFSDLMTSIQGRHFTPQFIFRILSAEVEQAFREYGNKKIVRPTQITICDPFAGDGRLVISALENIYRNKSLGILGAVVELWDIQFESTEAILQEFERLDSKYETKTSIKFKVRNTFLDFPLIETRFDLVITNPPWATVKPKKNKDTEYDSSRYVELTKALKDFDRYLAEWFPNSQPARKFAGWGTNLSRVGCELSLNLVADDGILAIVLPVSFLADESSTQLRKFVFSKLKLRTIDVYSAEDKLFEFADVGVTTIVGSNSGKNTTDLKIRWQKKDLAVRKSNSNVEIIQIEGRYAGNSLPVNFGKSGIKLHQIISQNMDFQSLENQHFIWAGRELDETGMKTKLKSTGDFQLAKGGNISPFSGLRNLPWLTIPVDEVPKSVNKVRIGWRDVSRASQKRRMIVTLIPKGVITGNSLNIAYVKIEPRKDFTFWLLAVMSSFVFEAQLRATLATDHVSLSAIRKILIPNYQDENYDEIVRLSKLSLAEGQMKPSLECQVAHSYKLDRESWIEVLNAFPKLTEFEREAIVNDWVKQ